MSFLEASIMLLFTIDALLMAFFGFLYGTYSRYYLDAKNENHLPDSIPYIGMAGKLTFCLICLATFWIQIDLVILLIIDENYKSSVRVFNIVGLSLLSFGVIYVSYHLARIMRSKRT